MLNWLKERFVGDARDKEAREARKKEQRAMQAKHKELHRGETTDFVLFIVAIFVLFCLILPAL